MSEWIGVKDRLPDSEDDLVLAHDSRYGVTDVVGAWLLSAEPDAYQYWMPLPPPPVSP